IGFVGRLSAERSPGLFLHAAKPSERIVFKVAGAGALTEHLVALSRQLGLSERVEFVGAVEASDMSLFLRSLDIVINP
ncbi:unnamed protein product, partial [Laminaria digitata]